MTAAARRSPRSAPIPRPSQLSRPAQTTRGSRSFGRGDLGAPVDPWAFDARDLVGLQPASWTRRRPVEAPAGSRCAERSRPGGPAVPLIGAAGLGVVGAAMLGAAPAQAVPVEFPSWAVVTGTVPDDAGLDHAAAEANDWTFSWSTDADGVVTFDYADGSRSTSLDPVARPAAPSVDPQASGDLAVQSLQDPLWEEDPARAESDAGLDDLAAVASAPFGQAPSDIAQGTPADLAGPAAAPAASSADPADVGGAVSDQDLTSTAAVGLGGRYVWGGTDFKAWDCSAFVQWVYAQHGIEIPRVTWDQFAAAQPTADPRPGDLVSQNGGSHVGIYLGGDRMISALNPQQGTIEHSVHDMPLDGYYTVR